MTPMFASGATTIMLVLAGMLLFTFLLQRPLKKQMAAQNELRASVAEGNRVLLTSQIFGTVTHVGDEQLIVEIAPGVEVTAMKQALVRIVTPQDEEFEFADPEDTVAEASTTVVEKTTPVGEAPTTAAEPVEAPVADQNLPGDSARPN
ncbi:MULTISPECIES: preprotein translocase subunit YajC [unclassified Luteococcus]|uniref:preprotein translocase subunit YajC n=1 Tax=unclassified Luteococcus TaxID=2639923 RepID=UPI00313C9F9A